MGARLAALATTVALACLALPAGAMGADGLNLIAAPGQVGEGDTIALGPDGNLWYTVLRTPSLVRVTPAGEATTFALPFPRPEVDGNVTAGSDGALWMTASGGQGDPERNRIVRVDTAGAVTEFHAPTAKANLGGIVAGPDGALWFTERGTGKLGRLTPGGAFTELQVPGQSFLPGPIAAGAEGNLWLIESGNSIARVTTAGEIISFPLPAAKEGARGIVAAPGGGVWISEFGRRAVARVDTAGAVTEYKLPAALEEGPDEIVVDDHGALWFLAGYGVVMRMTPNGRFTEFSQQRAKVDCGNRPCPGPPRPRDLTLGPDGKVWILLGANDALGGGNRDGQIARIDPDAPPPAPQPRIRPSLVGRPRIGVRLVVDAGSWQGKPTEYSVRWRACDRHGRECKRVHGQGVGLVLDRDLIGKRIVAELGATNIAGTTYISTRASAVVEPAPPPLRVELASGRARLDARGRARVTLACAGGPPGALCSGRVALRSARGGGVLGAVRYRFATGRHRVVSVPIGAAAAATIEAGGRLATRARVTLWGGKAAGARLPIVAG